MKTKLEAAIIMLGMAQREQDPERRDALLVGIHHALRRKLHDDRNDASRRKRGLKVWGDEEKAKAGEEFVTPDFSALDKLRKGLEEQGAPETPPQFGNEPYMVANPPFETPKAVPV